MTDAQTKKHWRCWQQVVAHNDWVIRGGRLSPDAQRTASSSIYHRAVWVAAEQLAVNEHRAITVDDLRHACYLVTTQHLRGFRKSTRVTSSSKGLENAAFSHLLALWGDEKLKAGLLNNAECLASGMAWEDPSSDAAEGLDVLIERAAPEARLAAICRNAFDCVSWRGLPRGQKQWLLRAVRGEQRKWNKPVRAAALSGIEEPY